MVILLPEFQEFNEDFSGDALPWDMEVCIGMNIANWLAWQAMICRKRWRVCKKGGSIS